MSINLAIAPIAWTNDDLPELGGDISLETCLLQAQKAGFKAIEKGGKFPKTYREQKEILDRYELRMIGGWHSGNLINGSVEEEKSRVKDQLELYQKWNCPVMVYGETGDSIQTKRDVPLDQKMIKTEDELKYYGEKLTEFSSFLKKEGCPLSFHHHMGTVIETSKEVDFLMSHTGDEVGLLWDTGHYFFAGGNPLDLGKKWPNRINYIHFKDVRENIFNSINKQKDSFLDSVLNGIFTVPGDGIIDFNPIVFQLKEMNYDGWICIEAEQDPYKADPFEYSKKGREYIEKILKDEGL